MKKTLIAFTLAASLLTGNVMAEATESNYAATDRGEGVVGGATISVVAARDSFGLYKIQGFTFANQEDAQSFATNLEISASPKKSKVTDFHYFVSVKGLERSAQASEATLSPVQLVKFLKTQKVAKICFGTENAARTFAKMAGVPVSSVITKEKNGVSYHAIDLTRVNIK